MAVLHRGLRLFLTWWLLYLGFVLCEHRFQILVLRLPNRPLVLVGSRLTQPLMLAFFELTLLILYLIHPLHRILCLCTSGQARVLYG